MSFLKKIVSQADSDVFILISLPIILAVANASWMFNAISHIDPGIYLGFFLRFEQYLNTFDGTYYATRLSWIIPGHIAYSIFPPLVANAVLDFGTFYLGVLSLYFTLKLTIDKRSALFAATLLSLHPLFLGNIGWDYVSGIGISYFLLAIYLITRAVLTGHNWLVLVFSGVTIGLTIYTNIFWIAFIPSLIIYYFAIRQKRLVGQFVFDTLMILIGLVLITSALGVVNYWANGNFWFFMPSLNYASNAIDQPNTWNEGWAKILPNSGWLITTGFTVVFSALILACRKKRFFQLMLESPFVLNFQLLLLLNFLILVVFELRGQPVLQYNYYASYLIPSVFLALGGQCNLLVNSLSRKHFLIFFCVFLILSVLEVSYQLSNIFWGVFLNQFSLLHFFGIAVILLGLWCYFASRNFKRNAVKFSLLGISLFACIAILTRPWAVNYYGLSRCPFKCGTPLEVTVQVQHFMKQYDPQVQALFWYNTKEDQYDPRRSTLYTSISSTFLWGYRLINEEFPQITTATANLGENSTNQASLDEIAAKRSALRKTLIKHQKVAILSHQVDALAQGIGSLQELGLEGKLIAKKSIRVDELSFDVLLLSVYEPSSSRAKL